jgi:hypothetical protein
VQRHTPTTLSWSRERCARARAEDVRKDVRVGNDLLAQLGEGVTFYSGMQEHVNKLKQMCADYCMARNMDRERRVGDIHRQQDSYASEEAARRMQQMDIALSGASHMHGHPHHAQQQSYAQPPPAPHVAQHMYPQASGPAPPGGASPFSMYPAAPPPQPQGQQPQGQQGGYGQQYPPPQQGQPQAQYYQPWTYPQPPGPR